MPSEGHQIAIGGPSEAIRGAIRAHRADEIIAVLELHVLTIRRALEEADEPLERHATGALALLCDGAAAGTLDRHAALAAVAGARAEADPQGREDPRPQHDESEGLHAKLAPVQFDERRVAFCIEGLGEDGGAEDG